MLNKTAIISLIILLLLAITVVVSLSNTDNEIHHSQSIDLTEAQTADIPNIDVTTDPDKVISSKHSNSNEQNKMEEKTEIASTILSIETLKTFTIEQLKNDMSLRFDCDNFEQIEDDPNFLSFQSFSEEHVLYNYEKLKPYALYNKEQLHEYAELGDSLAMYTLGLSYVNNSMYDEFTPDILKYNRDKSVTAEPKTFDQKLIQQGMYWLEQAASNEYPSAIFVLNDAQLSMIISKRASFDREEATEEEINRHDNEIKSLELKHLTMESMALQIFSFMKELPNNNKRDEVEDKMAKLTSKEAEFVNNETNNLINVWKNERQNNGYPSVVEYDISLEDLILGSVKSFFHGYCTAITNRF